MNQPSSTTDPITDRRFDVIVIGGGGAGLSGAVTLARARRSVLVIDAGHPRNAPAAGVHGLLSRDGLPPAELVNLGIAEVISYGGQVLRARVSSTRRQPAGLSVGTEDGREFSARRLLVTTGLVDELPDIPGLAQRWGRDVLHCPYCHGWEVRDQPIGVLATGPFAVQQALLFRQWTPDVTLFTHTAPELTHDEAEQLAAREISVVHGRVTGLEITNDHLTGVRMATGHTVSRRVLVIMPRMSARGDLLAGLGAPTVEDPRGSRVEADADGLTAVPGCG